MKIVALLLTACALAAQVKHEDIVRSPNADWLTVAGDFRGQRHSPLTQITTANANQLVPKWVHHIEKAAGLRTNPIVYQGIMYVTANNEVRGIDAASGRLIWQWKDARAKKDGANRGAALLGDRVFFITADCFLTALDRRTGAVLWQKQYAKIEDGVFATMAPFAVKDRVLVGVGGGG